MNLKKNKVSLRKELLLKRNKISLEEQKLKSNIIKNKIMDSDVFKNCKYIFVYINMNSEVITTDFILESLEKNKIVCVPISIPKSREMIFVKINNLDNLKTDNFGVKIPYLDKNNIVKSNNETLIIVPGLGFNIENYRIGYGGGYYDYFLDKNIYLKSIGIGFDFQIIENIPLEKFDKKLDLIISD